jgi:hypothetical protein
MLEAEADEVIRGRYIVLDELAAARGLFETPDVLSTSSCVLMAKWYVLPGVSPDTVMLSTLPAGLGMGSPFTLPEVLQLLSVMVVVL